VVRIHVDLRLITYLSLVFINDYCRKPKKDEDLRLGLRSPAHMPRQRSPLITLLLVLALRTTCFSQDSCIYLINASECLHEPSQRTQTGFVVKGTRGIFTALHGLVDAKHIGAVSEAAKEAFSGLKISMADPELDVALLDSKELDGKNLLGLESIKFSETVDPGPLKVIGHPYGIDIMPTNGLSLRSQKLVELRSLLTTDSNRPVQDRNSPSYKAKVLSIQGRLLPGDSGAPILDARNRVLAIANGGLKGGFAGISWAVPMNSVSWENNPAQTLDRLRDLKPDAVFFFAPQNQLGPLAEGVKLLLGELEFGFIKYKGEFLRESRDPFGAGIVNIFRGTLLVAGANSAECSEEYLSPPPLPNNAESHLPLPRAGVNLSGYTYRYKLNFGPLATESLSEKIRELRNQLNDGFPDYKRQTNLPPWTWSKDGHPPWIELEKANLPDGSYQVSVEIINPGRDRRW
jgi:Trypsin-like peptidase domain